MTQASNDNDDRLVIERHLAHPRERVFKAWTRRDALAAWMGPTGMSCPGAECDPRVGGRYRLPMQNDAGDLHTACGEYIEITPPERLSFTWAWEQPEGGTGPEMLVSVSFTETENGTLLTLVQERFADEETRLRHGEGWNASINCLETYLAAEAA